MQQSSAFEQELRAHYAAIVEDSFARARRCLERARLARLDGDHDTFQRMLWCVGVLRMAAAEWRKRAQHILPTLVLLWLAGCKTPHSVTVEGHVIPPAIVRAVCDQLPVQGRWDGHANLIVDHAGDVLGMECNYTVPEGARFLTSYAQVGIRAPQAQPLLAYLLKVRGGDGITSEQLP
jgi:hypothetical protein